MAEGREENPREGPLWVGQLGRGSLLGTLSSGPGQEVVDNGALWVTRSSCHQPIWPVGGERWRVTDKGSAPLT